MLRHSLVQHWLHFADPRIACPTRTTNHPLDALDSHPTDASSLRHRHGVGTTRKNAESSSQLNLTKNVHEVGQRRMKPADITNTSYIQSRPFDILAPPEGPSTLDFTTPLPKPDMNLTFLPKPPQSGPWKRSRAIADIDGEHSCTQKKKRRLRLVLITSRLSPQFSHPATNIVDRGSSKIAVWAKQKALGRNLLRKAAILNGIRRRNILFKGGSGGRRGRIPVENEKDQAQFELARLEFDHGSIDTYTRPVLSQDPSVPPSGLVRTGDHFVVSGSPSTSPTSSRSPSPTPPASPVKSSPETSKVFRSPNETWSRSHSLPLVLPRAQIPIRDYTPPPPSPLGISNYDALDVEHNTFNPYAHLDDEDEDLPSPFGDEDDDAVSFLMSTHPSSVAHTSISDTASLFSEFLDPPVGKRDWGEGEDGWGSIISAAIPVVTTLPSTSTATKRTDSFATSPNFRPTIPLEQVSEQHTSSSWPSSPSLSYSTLNPTIPASPNFTPVVVPSASTSMSPHFSPLTTMVPHTPRSPTLLSLASPRSMSPNFVVRGSDDGGGSRG
ncbi:hypothetical protein PTTW11_03496 [Pyrenophora teres f. teres]|uniref:Uncharacterized protein n=1 Tax=Pyrenophora teres f. teres TaxID=97479 RepID=A0A6S6VWW3_9PLEO|nr:hypothetical protein PTTW11_03496 [Pyrenophora teres f. teres]